LGARAAGVSCMIQSPDSSLFLAASAARRKGRENGVWK